MAPLYSLIFGDPQPTRRQVLYIGRRPSRASRTHVEPISSKAAMSRKCRRASWACQQGAFHDQPCPAMNHPILKVLGTCSCQLLQGTHRTARDDGMKFANIYDVLAREPPLPELMPLTMISADPPRRMMSWFCLAGAMVGIPSRIYRISSQSTACIHRPGWFERFLREMVGQDGATSEGGQRIASREAKRHGLRRKER